MALFRPPNIEKLKAKRDVKKLIKATYYFKNDEIRKKAYEALGEIDNKEARTVLLKELKDFYSRKDREYALSGLKKSKHPEAIKVVKEYMDKKQKRAIAYKKRKGEMPFKIVEQGRRQAEEWWKTSCQSNAYCNWCNKLMLRGDGYIVNPTKKIGIARNVESLVNVLSNVEPPDLICVECFDKNPRKVSLYPESKFEKYLDFSKT